MPTLVAFVTALVLHLTLGWAWTVVGGVVGGWLAVRRGWLVGLLGVGFGWLVLLAYAHVVAFGPVRVMTDTMAGIIAGGGNLPGAALVALTLFIGLLLGGLGGGIGSQLARLTGRSTAAAGRS